MWKIKYKSRPHCLIYICHQIPHSIIISNRCWHHPKTALRARIFLSPKSIFIHPNFVVTISPIIKWTLLTQTSISGPKYFWPSKTSGAAYGGEPHQVERVLGRMVIMFKSTLIIILLTMMMNTSTNISIIYMVGKMIIILDGEWIFLLCSGSPCRAPKVGEAKISNLQSYKSQLILPYTFVQRFSWFFHLPPFLKSYFPFVYLFNFGKKFIWNLWLHHSIIYHLDVHIGIK